MKNGTVRQGEFTVEEISQVVEDYRASGLGARCFARERGIPFGRFLYWVYQKGRSKAGELARPSVEAPRFQEAMLPAMTDQTAPWAVEVGLPDGVVVRFGGRPAPQWIGSVVQALRRPC